MSRRSVSVSIRIDEDNVDPTLFAALKGMTPTERRAILSLSLKAWLRDFAGADDLPKPTVSWKSKKIH